MDCSSPELRENPGQVNALTSHFKSKPAHFAHHLASQMSCRQTCAPPRPVQLGRVAGVVRSDRISEAAQWVHEHEVLDGCGFTLGTQLAIWGAITAVQGRRVHGQVAGGKLLQHDQVHG